MEARYIFVEHKGRNGRLSIQTDPRLHRDAKALADQAEEFSNLAQNSGSCWTRQGADLGCS